MQERVVVFIADQVLGTTKIKKNTYKNLDSLFSRGQTGFLSSFVNCDDAVLEFTGMCYYQRDEEWMKMLKSQVSVFKKTSKFDGFCDVNELPDSIDDIVSSVNTKLGEFPIVVVELDQLEKVDLIIGRMIHHIDNDNVALCVVFGYKEGSKVPAFPEPLIVDPSWKILGPEVVEDLSVDKPFMYGSASKALTRIDRVSAFDEDDVEENYGMGIMPICSLLREWFYYTGAASKYGA